MSNYKKCYYLYAVLILLFCAYQTAAQNDLMNSGGPLSAVYADTFSVEPVKTKIILPVRIHGKEYRFLLDTGAPLMVTKELAAILRIKDLTRTELLDQSGRRDSINIITTDTIRIGNTDYAGVPAIVMNDMPPALTCFGADGIIGSNLLRSSAVYWDMAAKQVVISRGRFQELSGVKGVPVLLDHQSNPFIKISAGKAKGTVLFDSGDDAFFEIGDKALQEWMKKSKSITIMHEGYGATTIGFNGMQESVKQYALMVEGLSIGGQTMDSVSAVSTSGDTRVGAGLFGLGRVLLDYAGKTFSFLPYAETKLRFLDAKWDILGLPDKGKMQVAIIWNQPLAQAAGINIGDEIITVNGRPAGDVTLCELIMGKPFGDVITLNMSIRTKNGAIKDVTIHKKM